MSKKKSLTPTEMNRGMAWRAENAAMSLRDYASAMSFAEWLRDNHLLDMSEEDLNVLCLDFVGRDAEHGILKAIGVKRGEQ